MSRLGDLRAAADGDRRAQLVLAGAVIIAAVIIGLALLVNSILYTETVSSEATESQIDDAQVSDFEFRKGVRSLVLRVNHAGRNVTEPEAKGRTRRNVSLFSNLLAEAHAKRRPVSLNVSYHNTSSETTVRVVQDHDANLSHDPGTGPAVVNWRPVDGRDTRVGWFTLNVNLRNTSRDHFVIEAENSSGATHQLQLNRTVNGTLQINETGDLVASERSTQCDPSSGRVLLDVYAGTSFTGDCAFNGTDVLAGPNNGDAYDIEFLNGHHIEGKFGIVTNETWPSSPAVPASPLCDGISPGDADPCRMPVVWSANVTTTIATGSLTYDNQYNITIYDRHR